MKKFSWEWEVGNHGIRSRKEGQKDKSTSIYGQTKDKVYIVSVTLPATGR